MRALLLSIFTLLTTSGCAAYHYSRVDVGELSGKLIVQWIDYDKFIFLPDEDNPLTFFKQGAEAISPEKMYTDGGTIPPVLWVIRHYSPWGYAPAYIVHDWLFVMHQCKLPGYEDYDLEKAARVMSEVMKTLMEDPRYGRKSELVLYSMYKAVRSPKAREFWDHGECNLPELKRLLAIEKEPLFEYVIEFP